MLSTQKQVLKNVELVSWTRDGGIVKITVHFSKELRPTHPDCLRYYNILFRRTLKLMNFKQIGRNYYDENSKENFCDNRLEAWRGYVTSVLPYEHSLTLCSDICHKLLRLETAYDIIMRRCEKSLQDKYIREEVSKELVGLIVFTRYNNKTYRVDAINWDQSPRDTFKKSDGSEITFVEYYMQQYNQIITDLDQPLLVSQGRWRKGQKNTPHEPVLLIPQLCYPTGLSDELRQKSKDMSKLTKFMQLYPWERKNELEAFINKIRVNRTAQNELQRWSLRFDTNCLPISGRILRDVKIFQRDVSFGIGPQPADWMRESRSTPLLTVKSLSHWVLLHPREHGNNAQSLLRSLRKVTPTMGITVGQANMYEVNEDPSSYISTLRKCVTSHTNMVVCILPDSEKHRYDEIKKFLCIHCPVPSQCVVAETLMSGNTLLTITTKIAQQMNCKMGGALWKVETGLQKTMFIGIDCFHDIVNRQKSIAGFVASTNEELTKWYSQCVFQEPGQELVDGLSSCLEAALDSWFRNVQQQPDSVVVYRDGVGDGQLQALLDHEIPQLVSHLRKHQVKLTFIVVKKRINTRFFVQSQGRLQNPPSGTVIDVALTREEWYDFYIVSQSSKHGTVTPTHYNVIYDTICLDPDTVQRLTYKLCHMYYNFPGTIRVPAPCHYAHKLAYFVGQNIQQEPHNSLSNCLYYL
ncbi:piwi-like protein 3 isoform X2 [Heterocephalus glaber]|uniref:Piwi-like protein 3 isoform X2 n=1 Tax=Heterocephalus glaber TaxID=10181 RepID=A0AAX6SWX0_HETGA|nr:piwi-like protein 3 isoform X2 [Heterocephalus glaber]